MERPVQPLRPFISNLLALALWLALAALPAQAAELVMFEQQACEWCEIWHRDIGPIYPKTAEGRRAPLRQVDIFEPLPDDLKHIAPGRFTPTFVLVEDGRELGRIRGYPGEDFFWGLLARMIEQLQPAGADENPS
jgi:thioredoxin-related protein